MQSIFITDPNHLTRIHPQLLLSLLIVRPWCMSWRTHPRLNLQRSLIAILQIATSPPLILLPKRRKNGGCSSLLRALEGLLYLRTLPCGLHLLPCMRLQPCHDPSRMYTKSMQSFGAVTALNLVSHVDVRGLGLPISAPGAVIGGLGEVVVGGIEAVGAVAGGGEADDTGVERGCGGGEEERFEEFEEEKVSEVVGTELGFEAVGGEGAGGEGHYTGVVYKDIEGLGFRFEG